MIRMNFTQGNNSLCDIITSNYSTSWKAYVIGVGMTKFEKPGRREDFYYPDMAREAGQRALEG